jgi:chaperonin GroES
VSEGGIILPSAAQEQTYTGWIVSAGHGEFEDYLPSPISQNYASDIAGSIYSEDGDSSLALAAAWIAANSSPRYRPVHVKVGDFVLYSRYAGVDVTINGEKLVLTKEDGVLAILKPIEEGESE